MPTNLPPVRIPDALAEQLDQAAKSRGLTVSAYVREALRLQLDEATRDEKLAALEDRVAASLNRMSRDLKNSRQDVQMLIAMLDKFVRQYLLHTPPVPAEAVKAAAASADDRHEKWVRGFLAEIQGPEGMVARLRDALLPTESDHD